MSFLLDRGETGTVTEAEERELREILSEWMVASGNSTCLLHVPHDIHDEEPLCRPSHHTAADWVISPVEVYPMGHNRVCPDCAEKVFRQVEQGLR